MLANGGQNDHLIIILKRFLYTVYILILSIYYFNYLVFYSFKSIVLI